MDTLYVYCTQQQIQSKFLLDFYPCHAKILLYLTTLCLSNFMKAVIFAVISIMHALNIKAVLAVKKVLYNPLCCCMFIAFIFF